MVPFWAIQEQSILRQGPGKRSLPGRRDKTPARGACRDDQLKNKDPGKRSLPGRPTKASQESSPRRTTRLGQAWRAASSQARQDTDRGKPLAAASHHLGPALQLTHPRVTLGLS